MRHYPALTQVAESSIDRNILWAGSDDGLIHVTRDGGKTWKNVIGSIPGVPKGTYVTRIAASRHAAGTAYVTFDGHRNNDFNIYAFTTTDFGETWKAIRSGIPDNLGVLNVIREHPKNPDLLFAGGEYGAYVSFSRGARWMPLKLNLPTVPVDDIVTDLPALTKLMNEAGVTHVTLPPVTGPRRTPPSLSQIDPLVSLVP